MNALIKAVQSLIADVEGMQTMVTDMTDSFENGFGPFSEFVQDGNDAMYIEWPNLAISADQVKAELAKLTPEPGIVGTKADLIIMDEIAQAEVEGANQIRIHGSERDLDWNG